jgi:hypothetical protein
MLNDADLVAHFGSSENEEKRLLGMISNLAQEFHFPGEKKPRKRRKKGGNAFGGSMGSMRSAKGIHHKNIEGSCQSLRKGRVILLLLRVKPEVFKKQELFPGPFFHTLPHLFPHAIFAEKNLPVQKILKGFYQRAKRILGDHFALRTSQMGYESDFRPSLKKFLNRGDMSSYTCVVGNGSLFVKRNVVIHSKEHSLSLQGRSIEKVHLQCYIPLSTMYWARSRIRQLYPHSLSYHARVFTRFSTTVVCMAANMEE